MKYTLIVQESSLDRALEHVGRVVDLSTVEVMLEPEQSRQIIVHVVSEHSLVDVFDRWFAEESPWDEVAGYSDGELLAWSSPGQDPSDFEPKEARR